MFWDKIFRNFSLFNESLVLALMLKLLIALGSLVAPGVSGHAFLASPRPRQWRSEDGAWVTVNVLSDDKPFLW